MRSLLPILILLLSYSARAQVPLSDTTGIHPPGVHLSVYITNSGFGAGIGVSYPLSRALTMTLDTSMNSVKDEREQVYFTGPFGESVVLFKRNYFMVIPIRAGLERRLWSEYIDDSFRPFVQIGAGPVIGYQWPYFDDLNNNGIRDQNEEVRGLFNLSDGEFRIGAEVFLGLGAYMGDSPRTASLRAGYLVQMFTQPVDLMELRPEIDNASRRFLTTPTLRFHLPL